MEIDVGEDKMERLVTWSKEEWKIDVTACKPSLVRCRIDNVNVNVMCLGT